jgi:uncharacterized membrane protein
MHGGVEVKVSYAARIGCTVAIGGSILLLFVIGLVASLLGGGASSPPSSGATSSLPTCGKDLSGADFSCSKPMEANGTNLFWKTTEAGTFTFTVKSPGQPKAVRSLSISRLGGKQAGADYGAEGRDSVVTFAATPGDYMVSVTDLLTPTVGKPFVVAVAKKGGAPKAAGAPAASSDPPVSPGLFAVPLLAAIFLVIPLVLAAEKAKIPLRLDPGGVTMRDGRVLAWNEYQRIEPMTERMRSGRTIEVGVALVFARGRAELRYRPITNWGEVAFVVDALKAGRYPFG